MLEKKSIMTIDHMDIVHYLEEPEDATGGGEPEDATGGGPELLKNLKKHGPALVHCFKANEDFAKAEATWDDEGKITIPFFDKQEISDLAERHAMTLVGIRKVDDKWRFLLQNWWPNLQLVEVSAQYLVRSRAELVLSVMKQMKTPAKFARCDHV